MPLTKGQALIPYKKYREPRIERREEAQARESFGMKKTLYITQLNESVTKYNTCVCLVNSRVNIFNLNTPLNYKSLNYNTSLSYIVQLNYNAKLSFISDFIPVLLSFFCFVPFLVLLSEL